MRGRILFGVVAWLLGAAMATAGSLLASSLLSQGISGNAGQLLTQDAVNKALASEAAEQSPSPSAARSSAPSTARPTTPPAPSPATSAPAPVQGATASTPASSDNASGDGSSGGGTVLTSAGGDVVASCQAAGIYLISWSPSQGYEVSSVNRGPAATASVSFESSANQVTMVVSCSAGVPSATTRTGDS